MHAGEDNSLIASEPGALVYRIGVKPTPLNVGFGADHEEGANQVQLEKSFEVQIGPIHDVECTRLRDQKVQCVDVVKFAI